jgi:hypothetical protein
MPRVSKIKKGIGDSSIVMWYKIVPQSQKSLSIILLLLQTNLFAREPLFLLLLYIIHCRLTI